jgi:hypothetical protein
MQIGNITINKYKCQWHYQGRQNHVIRTLNLHSQSMDSVKIKAERIQGSKPDSIVKVG